MKVLKSRIPLSVHSSHNLSLTEVGMYVHNCETVKTEMKRRSTKFGVMQHLMYSGKYKTVFKKLAKS